MPDLVLGRNIPNNSTQNLIVSYQVNTVRLDNDRPDKLVGINPSSYVLPPVNRGLTTIDNDIRSLRPKGLGLGGVHSLSKNTLGAYSQSQETGMGGFTVHDPTLNFGHREINDDGDKEKYNHGEVDIDELNALLSLAQQENSDFDKRMGRSNF